MDKDHPLLLLPSHTSIHPAGFSELAMVEQDLVISRALIELYNQPVIAEELVFRGGTWMGNVY